MAVRHRFLLEMEDFSGMTNGDRSADWKADVKLESALGREEQSHLAAAENAARDRRAVWLRLFEEHGFHYMDIADLAGCGTTRVHTELRKARAEREIRDPGKTF